MFEIGAQVGSYTIVRRLGAGGMGEVYLGRHRHIGRDAAIKVLLPELSQNEDVVARFFTEARATATIRHPGIVEILDCDIHKSGRAYIVMEFLDGENLAERLVRAGSYAVDIPTAGLILAQAAGAVGAAHAKGIVHRDLKPDNVFLCGADGPGMVPLVKILDFGVAKLITDDGKGRNRTRTGSLLGTPTYMSPEQCRGAGSIDHRTDLYALGCMGFEIISGRPPFVRDGAGEVLVAHLVEKPPTLSSLVPDVAPELDALVGQMLEKDAAARPQSMAEVVSRLEALFGVAPNAILPGEGLSGAMRLPPTPTPPIGSLVSPAGATRSPSGSTPAPGGSSVPAAGTAPGTTPVVYPAAHAPAAHAPATHAPAKHATPTHAPPATHAPAPYAGVGVIAGGTRVMQAVSRTTLGDTASEREAIRDDPDARSGKPRWLIPALAAGGTVVVGVVLMMVLSGPSKPPPVVTTHQPPPPPVHQPIQPPPRPVTPPPPVEVTVELASDPSGAEVWLPGDDKARGHTPLKIAVRRGDPPASVTLKAAGYSDSTIAVDPARAEDGPLNVVLEKIKRERSGKRRGKGTGPKDENDIYKAMGD